MTDADVKAINDIDWTEGIEWRTGTKKKPKWKRSDETITNKLTIRIENFKPLRSNTLHSFVTS